MSLLCEESRVQVGRGGVCSLGGSQGCNGSPHMGIEGRELKAADGMPCTPCLTAPLCQGSELGEDTPGRY